MATDEQLIHQIKQGENEAFRQLFHKYQKQIYFICLNIVKNPHDTEEVVQDTFVHAYLKIDQLKKPDKFSAWLKRIAQNCSINYVNRKPEESIPLAVATAQISTQTIPDRLLLRRELVDAIMEAIESLPQEDREMIRARIDGLSHSEISEQFGISISASTTRLYRVRKKIKACMKDLLNAIVWLPKMQKATHDFVLAPPFKKIISGGIKAMKVGTSKEVATGIFAATQSLIFSVIFHTALFISLSFLLPYKFHSDRQKIDVYLEVSLIPTEEQQPMQRLPKGEAKPAISVHFVQRLLREALKSSFPPIKQVSSSQVNRGFLAAQKLASQSEIGEAASKISQDMKELQIGVEMNVTGGERIVGEAGKGEEILSTVDVKRGLEVGKGDIGLTDGVDELAKGRGGMKLEITRLEKLKPVSPQKEKFGKQAGLSMLGDIGVADADDTLANVTKDMILDQTGFSVPELPKGEPGGIIIGRGKDMKGRLRLGMLSCSMVDKRYAQGSGRTLNCWMKWINANSNIKVDINVEGGAIKLTDANLFKCPVLFLFGYNEGMHSVAGWSYDDPTLTGKNRWIPGLHAANHLSSRERQHLRKYLIEKGGVLFVDTLPRIISSYYGKRQTLGPPYPWSTRMKRELRTILPEYDFQNIDNQHQLYHCFYNLGGMPPGLPRTKSGPDVASGFFGFLFSPSAYLQGISIDGRLSLIYSEKALAYIANDYTPSSFDYLTTKAAFRFLTNVVVYGLTHSGISDKSRYVPEKEIQESAEKIPKKPPLIPSPTPNSHP